MGLFSSIGKQHLEHPKDVFDHKAEAPPSSEAPATVGKVEQLIQNIGSEGHNPFKTSEAEVAAAIGSIHAID